MTTKKAIPTTKAAPARRAKPTPAVQHTEDLKKIAEKMQELADAHGFCGTFYDAVDELNNVLHKPIPLHAVVPVGWAEYFEFNIGIENAEKATEFFTKHGCSKFVDFLCGEHEFTYGASQAVHEYIKDALEKIGLFIL